MNAELVAMDFATMTQRAGPAKEPVERGRLERLPRRPGPVTTSSNPAVNQMLRAGGVTNGWWGWAENPALEAFAGPVGPATGRPLPNRSGLATEIQVEAAQDDDLHPGRISHWHRSPTAKNRQPESFRLQSQVRIGI